MKKTLIFFFSIFSMYLSSTVSADMIDFWDFSVDAKISQYQLGNGITYTTAGERRYDNSGNPSTSGNYYSRLTHSDSGSTLFWGEWANNQAASSGITVEGKNGVYEINGPASDAAAFIHTNNAISSLAQTPNFIDISLNFNFTNKEDPSLSAAGEVVLHMGFFETLNGDPNTESDIFYFLDPFSAYEKIEMNNSDYYLSLFTTFTALDQDSVYYAMAAERLGISDGTDIWGWITPEGTTHGEGNAFTISFEIGENPPSVPEPATMLILGLAAAGGLPFALRRRTSKKS